MNNQTYGGKRDGSGRKKMAAEERKTTLPVYPQKKMIDLVGYETAQRIAIQAIEREYKKKMKKS